MFRECFFEYAGKSSQPYNLMLCYAGNSMGNFDSGGKYDLKTDTIPRYYETLYYGKDYSAQPLEFEVELMNIDRNIPFDQFMEIKNWLFEQDGWKTFRCIDERQDYSLKCVFEPIEDIADGTGYRGLRCKLRNASPFWYGDPITVSTSSNPVYYWDGNNPSNAILQPDGNSNRRWQEMTIYVPDDCADVDILPQIHLNIARVLDLPEGEEPVTTPWQTAVYQADKQGNNFKWNSGLEYSNRYFFSRSTFYTSDSVDISARYGTVLSQNEAKSIPMAKGYPLPMLRLHRGENTILIHTPNKTTATGTFTFTPLYRVGAF